MTKVYEIFVDRMSEDGHFVGTKRIAVVSSKKKAMAKIEAFRKEHEVHQYWMSYRLDENKHIKMTVAEVEVE